VKWIVLIRPEAERDLAAARDWYDQKCAGLGDEFLSAVATGVIALESEPELPRLYFGNFRRIHVARFPYKIFYQTIGSRVIVFRVLHAKRDHTKPLQ
jgi:toxin ParE1/3/4